MLHIDEVLPGPDVPFQPLFFFNKLKSCLPLLSLFPHPHLNSWPDDSYCQPSTDDFLVNEILISNLVFSLLSGLIFTLQVALVSPLLQASSQFSWCQSLDFPFVSPSILKFLQGYLSLQSPVGGVCWGSIVTCHFCTFSIGCMVRSHGSTSIYNTHISISGLFCQPEQSVASWASLLAISHVYSVNRVYHSPSIFVGLLYDKIPQTRGFKQQVFISLHYWRL